MTTLLVVAGTAILALTMLDVVWTTVAAGSGAGPLTGRLSRWTWRRALAVHRRFPNAGALSPAGVAISLAMLLVWIALVLGGWFLIFSASDGAVRSATTGDPADLVSTAYFVGYTVFTLGLGDYVPGEGSWQLATVLATGSGLVLVTLSITYLVPVASAVVQRRQLAGQIASLGGSGTEIVVRGWDGDGFGTLAQQLASLLPSLHLLRLQHLTYPVLHYFHSRSEHDAAAINVVHLDHAVSLLRHGVAPEARPDAQVLDAVSWAIGRFLSMMDGVHLHPADEHVERPSLQPLVDAGISVDEEGYARHASDEHHRRRLLASYLRDDGWTRDDTADL